MAPKASERPQRHKTTATGTRNLRSTVRSRKPDARLTSASSNESTVYPAISFDPAYLARLDDKIIAKLEDQGVDYEEMRCYMAELDKDMTSYRLDAAKWKKIAQEAGRNEEDPRFRIVELTDEIAQLKRAAKQKDDMARLAESKRKDEEEFRFRNIELTEEIVQLKQVAKQGNIARQAEAKTKDEELAMCYRRINRLEEANEGLATEIDERKIEIGQAASGRLARGDTIQELQAVLTKRNVKIEKLETALKKKEASLAEKQDVCDKLKIARGEERVGVGNNGSILHEQEVFMPNKVREEPLEDGEVREYGTVAEPGFGFLSNTAWRPKHREYR
ncbi:hypothetical protein Q7P37_010853 [Cladosporium fusiforme]